MKILNKIAIFAIAALLCGQLLAASMAPAEKILPYPIYQHKLANGLNVVTVPFDSPGLVALHIVTRVGARNEVEEGVTGFAHFFEHMMFRGTKTYPPPKYRAVLQDAGADDNASTSDDRTFFHIVARSDVLDRIAEIEADRFQHLSYSRQAFQTEARAVLGEYRKSMANPWWKMWEVMQKTAFTRHTYQHTVLGFLRDIEAMPRHYRYSRKFFKWYYRPDNATLLVTGDVTSNKVRQVVEQYYETWRGRAHRVRPKAEPEQKRARLVRVPWTGRTVPRILIGYRIPGFDPTTVTPAALAVAAEWIFAKTSAIYKDLVLNRRLVSSMEVDLSPHRDSSLFYVMVALHRPEDIQEVTHRIADALQDAATVRPSKQAIARIRSHTKYALILDVNTPKAVLGVLMRFVTPRGKASDLVAYLRQLDMVTPNDVSLVVQRYLVPAKATYVALYQGKDQTVYMGSADATQGTGVTDASHSATGRATKATHHGGATRRRTSRNARRHHHRPRGRRGPR